MAILSNPQHPGNQADSAIQACDHGISAFFVSVPITIQPDSALAQSPPTHFKNTGNLLFSTAVWRQVAWSKAGRGFNFDPAVLNRTFDLVIIPAANWLNEREGPFGHLADLVERLDIPVVMIGLGAQGADANRIPKLPENTLRLVRAVAHRSRCIGARGTFTAKVLHNYGIENVVVTGCPSVYVEPAAWRPVAAPTRLERIAVGGTGHSSAFLPQGLLPAVPRTLQREIYRLAYREGLDVVLQSERPEIDFLITGNEKVADAAQERILDYWGAPSLRDWCRYLDRHGRVFYDVGTWVEAMARFDCYLGSRLHGTIAALTSGTPACLLTHDARTTELAQFLRSPSLPIADAMPLSRARLEEVMASIDLDAWNNGYAERLRRYIDFLEENEVPHRFSDASPTPPPGRPMPVSRPPRNG